MSRTTLITGAGVAASALTLAVIAFGLVATTGPNGGSGDLGEVAGGLWVVFAVIALSVGMVAARVAAAILDHRRARRRP